MSGIREVMTKAIYQEYENRPAYAQGQMNSVLAEELADAVLSASADAGWVMVPSRELAELRGEAP